MKRDPSKIEHVEYTASSVVTAQRMRTRLAVLGAAHVQRGGAAELDLAPFEIDDFAGAQAVTIGDRG